MADAHQDGRSLPEAVVTSYRIGIERDEQVLQELREKVAEFRVGSGRTEPLVFGADEAGSSQLPLDQFSASNACSVHREMDALPNSLRLSPIMEAVFEIRFEPLVPTAGDLLPGLLFPQMREKYPTLEALPIASIPRLMRTADLTLPPLPDGGELERGHF